MPIRGMIRKTFINGYAIAAGFILFAASYSQAAGLNWQELKGKHFVIYYLNDADRAFAKDTLRNAEKYYTKINDLIGYKRYSDFWTWDQRAKIFIFPDQDKFMEVTGQPAWSLGGAARDESLIRSRAIISYKQESEFLNGILPHEIGHLVIHDFFSWKNVPVWLDEGIAQLYEDYKREIANKYMRYHVHQGKYIPFASFTVHNIRNESEPGRVEIFYAQSISVLDFLLKRYGDAAFRKLCQNLKNGKSMEDALRNAYSNNIKTLADLERKWLIYMKQ